MKLTIEATTYTNEDVLGLLDYPAYFGFLKSPLPENRDGILSVLESDGMIVQAEDGRRKATNLGALLFAKRLTDFHALGRILPYRLRNQES